MAAVQPVAMTYLYEDRTGPEWPCDGEKLARAVKTMVEAANHPWNSFKLLVRLSDGSSTVVKPKKRRA